jgi:hypothetical protein
VAERRAELQKAVNKQIFLESNSPNFENRELTEASKNETKTSEMLARIEKAKKRRALFTRVFGTGSKPIGSFDITKAPNLEAYENAIKGEKYEKERKQLENAKSQTIKRLRKGGPLRLEEGRAATPPKSR